MSELVSRIQLLKEFMDSARALYGIGSLAPGERIPILPPGEEIKIVKTFKFNLGGHVVLATSLPAIQQEIEDKRRDAISPLGGLTVARLGRFLGPIEEGTVIGRAEYLEMDDQYFTRYRAGDGRQVESWIGEKGLAYDPRDPAEAPAPEQASADEDAGYRAEAVRKVPDSPQEAAPVSSVTDTTVEGDGPCISLSHEYADGSRRYISIPVG